MNKLTTYDTILFILAVFLTGAIFGTALARSDIRKQAIQANAAHYELVNGGPETEFKWGPKS